MAKAHAKTEEMHDKLNLGFTDIRAFTMKAQRNRHLNTSLLRFILMLNEDWSIKERIANLNETVSNVRELKDFPWPFSLVLFFVPLYKEVLSFSYGNCWSGYHGGKLGETF